MSATTHFPEARVPTKPRDTAAMTDGTDDEEEMSPTRVRVGLGIIAVVLVVAFGVLVTVEDAAARFLFMAIIVLGIFQTWRIFRKHRKQ
jgi:hypothetical protein